MVRLIELFTDRTHRGTSSKTRIETYGMAAYSGDCSAHRGTSSKTRIETLFQLVVHKMQVRSQRHFQQNKD